MNLVYWLCGKIVSMARTMNYRRQLLSILTVACVLVGGIGFVSWQNDQHYIATKTNEFQHNQIQFARQLAERVAANFAKLYDALYSLSQMPKIQFLVKNDTLLHLVRTFNMNDQLVDGIARVDRTNTVQYVYPDDTVLPTRQELQPVFDAARMTGKSIFRVIRRQHDATDTLVIVRPVYTVQGQVHLNPSNKFSGLILFVASLQGLQTTLFDLSLFGSNGAFWMLDEQGWLVGGTDRLAIGKSLASMLPATFMATDKGQLQPLVATILSGTSGVATYVARPQHGRRSEITEPSAAAGKNATSVSTQDQVTKNRVQLIAYTPLQLPDQQWMIVVNHPKENVTLSIHKAIAKRWFHSLAIVCTVLGMTLALMVMIRRNHQYQMQVFRDGEEALREAEEKYRTLVEYANDAIVILQRGETVYCNPAFVTLLGYAVEETMTWHAIDLFVLEDRERVAAFERQRSDAEAAPEQYEMGLMTRDGQQVTVEAKPRVIQYLGEPATMMVMRDVTERKQAEATLAQHARDLARSNADLEQFAYVASHDLQEPLRKITSFTELLAKHLSSRLDDDAETFMGFITDGATRMQGLIRDLLAYSRVGKSGTTFEPTDVTAILQETLSTMELSLQEQHAEVTYDPLPTVMGKPTLIRQLFQNLVSNALKFHGPKSLHVHVSAELQDEQWLFAVRDNGIGIEPQYAERIFVIFQRLHSRVEYPGTGIGLAICQKIVEHHGGRIWVESELGQGTTFYYTLPMVEGAWAEESAQLQEA